MMKLNNDALKHAKKLIKDGKVDMDSDWSEAQPSADEENDFIESHDYDAYAQWHLAEDPDETESKDTKSRWKFIYGDFKKVHRDGVIAAKQRAAQWDYHDIEEAADELLTMIDDDNAR